MVLERKLADKSNLVLEKEKLADKKQKALKLVKLVSSREGKTRNLNPSDNTRKML